MASIDTIGDSFDGAPAESIIGLSELSRHALHGRALILVVGWARPRPALADRGRALHRGRQP